MMMAVPEPHPVSTSEGEILSGLPACRTPEVSEPDARTEFTRWDALSLAGGGGLDERLQRLTRGFRLDTVTSSPVGATRGELLKALAFYSDPELHANPARFFPAPEVLPRLSFARPHGLPQGEIVDASFESGYVPHYPGFRDRYREYVENRHVRLRFWRQPRGESRGTIVAVNGWCGGDSRLHSLVLHPGFFFRLGLDVVIYELPHHGARNGSGQPPAFPGPDIALTSEGIGQAVYELRALLRWLRHENEQPVGMLGVSLGAYVAALCAALDDLSFLIALVPLVFMARLALQAIGQMLERSHPCSRLFATARLDQFVRAYAFHCPLRLPQATGFARRLIVAAAADTVIPTAQSSCLQKGWPGSAVVRFEGDHFGFHSPDALVFPSIRRFLMSLVH